MYPHQNKKPAGRLEYLDSLRGVGAVIVALTHLATFLPLFEYDSHFFNGVSAVSVFFVLSGYVLSLGLVSAKGIDSFSLVGFVVRRLCRIGIPFVAALALAFVLHSLTGRNPPSSPPFFSDYLERWSMEVTTGALLSEFINFYSPNLLAPSWTLRPELQNSILLPFALLLLHNRPRWFLFAFLLGVAFNFLPQGGLHFGLGAILAFYQRPLVKLAKQIRIEVLGPFIFLLVYVLNIRHIGPVGPYGVWAFVSALLILAMLSSPFLQAVAVRTVPGSLGRTSFSFYLLSWPLMFVLAPLAMDWLESLEKAGPALWSVVAVFCLGCTYVASLFFYRWCEEPSIRAGKFLASVLDRYLAVLLPNVYCKPISTYATVVQKSWPVQ